MFQHGVAEVGTKGQVLNLFGSMAKQAPDITDFKQKPPDKVTNHVLTDLSVTAAKILNHVTGVNCGD